MSTMPGPVLALRACRALAITLWACAAPAWSAPGHALVARLDDSTSPRPHVQVDTRHARVIDGGVLELPFGRVEYRLATAPYLGQRARIFHVIPLSVAGMLSPAGLQVQWRGNGSFTAGAGRPGDRIQVWNGLVQTPWMIETLDLNLRIDPRQFRLSRGSALSFESFFEIETLP